MSAGEKENFVSLISTILVSVPYFFFTFSKYSNSTFSGNEELKFWATTILIIIPVRIIVQIVVYILFTIFRSIAKNGQLEKEITDERDKLIELKGDRVSTNAFVFGVMIAMLAVLSEGTLEILFTVILASGFISELLGIFAKIAYYKKGG